MEPFASQLKVLCIEQDQATAAILRDQLDTEFEFHSAESGEKALEMILELGPYEAVISNSSAGNDGEILSRIREISPATVNILLAHESDLSYVQQAVEDGQANKYITKPYSQATLIETINSAVSENTTTLHKLQLEEEASSLVTDYSIQGAEKLFDYELGIGSTAAMQVDIEHMHNVALRYQRHYSVAIFDIDEYEAYEKHYSVESGKLAHKLMAEHIRYSSRLTDRLYRYNTKTPILLILPETPEEGAAIMVERVVKSFVSRNIPNSKSNFNLLTLSGSFASYSPDDGYEIQWQEILDEVLLYLHVAQASAGNTYASANKIE